ncbi:MAG: tagaturonate epimerase family protein [Anaerolineae bacterium]
MISIETLLQTKGESSLLPAEAAKATAASLEGLSALNVYPRSIVAAQEAVFFLGKRDGRKHLGILTAGPPPGGFQGKTRAVMLDRTELSLTLGPADAANASALRSTLPFLIPRPLGLKKSIGCGDRLGLATPGHIRAVRKTGVAPIFAQQSMRENARTGRTPQEVLDEAMWGVFQEGWRQGYGADADHLKTTADIDLCAAAGYTFYTIDPGQHVDDSANTAGRTALESKAAALPWDALDSSPVDTLRRLAGKRIDLGGFELTLSEEEVLRAAVKYGRAVAHTAEMYRHALAATSAANLPFELEMSVDETATVTSLAEHIYIAGELQRLGVRWVSLAPRYVGRFEKGVDYQGEPGLSLAESLARFEESFAQHLAVAKAFGPYKLSLHSGSDKFSIYPIAARLAGDLVHLKTAGTSYLEALRAIASLDPALFRDILVFALERYASDRATYHVSAQAANVPDAAALGDDQLPVVLDNFDGREVLHVTFGSVLNEARFRERFFSALRANEEVYYRVLETHFDRHLAPFS